MPAENSTFFKSLKTLRKRNGDSDNQLTATTAKIPNQYVDLLLKKACYSLTELFDCVYHITTGKICQYFNKKYTIR